MKSDLDRLMQTYSLEAIFVLGGEMPNMQRDYLMKGAHTSGYVIKKRGAEPVAIVGGMEIDEAAKSGLKIYTYQDFGAAQIRQQYKTDFAGSERALMSAIFDKLEISGRVGFYGTADVSHTMWLTHDVLSQIPNIEVVYDHAAGQLFENAYETKDPDEIASLKEAARLSGEVVAATWDFISHHHADSQGNVVDVNGSPLTIGAVKRFIRLQELERGLKNAAGMIFAQGRDAAIPHSSGEDTQTLRTGQSIVFDFFPRLVESGYYHDMTRTWSIGFAEPEIQAAYDQVMSAFQIVTDSLQIGDPLSLYQQRVCDLFEASGHPTPRTHPGTMEGYVHSLGHGLGLICAKRRT